MAKHFKILSLLWKCIEFFFWPHREKKQQVKNLAIWHWFLPLGSRALFVLRGGCPQCAQKRGRLSSPELFLSSPFSPSPPTICLSALFMNVQVLFLIDFENVEFWRLAVQSLHAHRQKPKRKQLCVCFFLIDVHLSKNISEKEIMSLQIHYCCQTYCFFCYRPVVRRKTPQHYKASVAKYCVKCIWLW